MRRTFWSPLACCLMMFGARAASAQCYVFSSGSQASLKVNLPSLPQPVTNTAGLHVYTLTSANSAGDTATVTVGQTSYTFLPAPPELQLSANATIGTISYGYIPLSASISTTEFGIT